MHSFIRFTCTFFLFILAINPAAAQSGGSTGTAPAASTSAAAPSVSDSSPSRYVSKSSPARIPRAEAAPVIDGLLNDAVWNNAAVFGEFIQTNPGDNVPPKHLTEFMMAYDSKNLYFAFNAKQDRNTVRATMPRRDNIFNDDYFVMYLDTFNDQRQAYSIALSPLGVQADGTYTEGRGEDYSVDIVMESKGVLTEDGFTIELAIPFKSLRYEAGKSKNWGLHVFRRVKYNNNELDSWMPNNRSINGSLIQAGKITGLEGIETTRQLEINPSLTVSETGRRTRNTFNNDPAGRYVNEGLKGDFGMTAKFSLSPAVTLDFAYNPDFAQVEADAPVSTTNVRFPIFFAEKRPFFLERIDIFQSPFNLVNTRAIVDPDIAAKITGRRGKNTFGLMYASDNAPGNYSIDERESLLQCQNRRVANPNAGIVCGTERFVDENADIGVFRVKRDIGATDSIGAFLTTYNFVDRHNHLAAFDGRFKLSPKTVFEFVATGTNSRRTFYNPDLDKNEYRTGNGIGYRVFIQRQGRNLYMDGGLAGRSRDYRADVGFTPRTDTNQGFHFVQYQTDSDTKKSIIRKRLFNNGNISYDWKGRLQSYGTNTQGMISLQRQIYIGTGVYLGYERLFEHEFGRNRTATRSGAFFGPDNERSAHRKESYSFIEASPIRQLFFFGLVGHTWGSLDYDFGAGQNYPRVSGAYVSWQQRCAQVTVCTEPAPALDPGAGNTLFIEASVRYQPTTALQLQVNYNRRRLIRNDTGLVAFDDNILSVRSVYQFTRDIFARVRLDYSNVASRVRPQFVLGWTPSPGKALYVGYNDDLNYNGYNPYTGIREPGLRGNGRSFFIKASYLFKKSF